MEEPECWLPSSHVLTHCRQEMGRFHVGHEIRQIDEENLQYKNSQKRKKELEKQVTKGIEEYLRHKR